MTKKHTHTHTHTHTQWKQSQFCGLRAICLFLLLSQDIPSDNVTPKQNVSKFGLQIVDTKPDGNCLFYSIAYSLIRNDNNG